MTCESHLQLSRQGVSRGRARRPFLFDNMVQTEARAARKAAEAAAAAAAAAEAAKATEAAKAAEAASVAKAPGSSGPSLTIKKTKRPGKQARERAKLGMPVRPKSKRSSAPSSDEMGGAGTAGVSVEKPKWPSRLKDKWFVCVDCSKDVSWPVDQQELFKSQGFDYIIPKRCPGCMRAKKAKYGEGKESTGPTHCFNWCVDGSTAPKPCRRAQFSACTSWPVACRLSPC